MCAIGVRFIAKLQIVLSPLMIFIGSWIRLCKIGAEYMCCMGNVNYSSIS